MNIFRTPNARHFHENNMIKKHAEFQGIAQNLFHCNRFKVKYNLHFTFIASARTAVYHLICSLKFLPKW